MLKILAQLGLFASVATAFDTGAPLSRLPPLGWSSWEAFGPGTEHPVRDYCDENSVKAAADAFITTGLYDAGYRHFHLDDCWSVAERVAGGPIQADTNRFPNGMKAVVDYVHSKNLTFGLYTSAGTRACMSSRAGSYGHWEEDAKAFASWEVDWVSGLPVCAHLLNINCAPGPTARSNKTGVGAPVRITKLVPRPQATCPQH